MIAQLYSQTGAFLETVELPSGIPGATHVTVGTRFFTLQTDGTYREAALSPGQQAVTLPVKQLLGGLANEDGF